MISVDPYPAFPDVGSLAPGWTYCRCCGGGVYWGRIYRPAEEARCKKHWLRNPCAIEGCTKTTAAPESCELSLNDYFCGDHWRLHVPPRSPQRQIYNRFFRRAKKFGWTPESTEAFWRYWRRLVSRARARERGDVDMNEINRLMGWD